MGAALAYYTLFSMGPILLIAISIAGLVWGADEARIAVVHQIAELIGQTGADSIDGLLSHTRILGSGTVGAVIGIGSFLLASTALFVQIQDDLNVIFKVQRRSSGNIAVFLQQRLLSFALLIALGFALLVSLALDAGLASVTAYFGLDELELFYLIVNTLLGWTIAVVIFALIFSVLPTKRPGRQATVAGALLSGTLLIVGKFLIGFYLGRADVVSAYGAAGSVVLILLWIYYSSQTLFLGAELARTLDERPHGRISNLSDKP
jgi:membrane protein